MALKRDQIVAAAIALLDEGGLEQLSLRRLAERLDVGVSTLYWHVRDKRHLLDLMAEAFTQEVLLSPPAEGEAVWVWMEAWSRSLFTALLTHPDGARIMAGNRLSPESYPAIERVLDLLALEGYPPTEAVQVLLALGAYVIGVALDVQEEEARPDDSDEQEEDLRAFPNLAAAGFPGTQERFDGGLRILFAGIRAAGRAQPPPPPPPPPPP